MLIISYCPFGEYTIHCRTIQNTYRYLVVSDPFIIVRVMVFNTTFNNISVLLVEETRVPRENH